MNKVRFGIVGMGSMWKGHMNDLVNGEVKDAELTAVVATDPVRLEWVREQ